MKHKKISILILTIFLGFILVACNKTKDPKATVDKLEITRTTFTLVFTVEDKDNVLNMGSIEGKLTYKETTLINTYEPTKVKDDEGNEIENTFQIIGTNLSINHEYTIKVTGVANRKMVTLIDETFRTKHQGSSSENPIYIETVEDFLNLEDDYNAYYQLVNDLDFSEVEEFTPLFLSRAFSGNFDGNNKTLSNITINKRHTYTALIGRNAGTIKNLNIENMNIDLSGTAQSSQYISFLAGRNTGTIENVSITNSKIVTHFSHSGLIRIGGISAYSESGSKINDSTVDVIFDITSISRTEYNIGGIAGQLNGGSMSDNKAKTKIDIYNSTTAYIGGTVGLMDASTINDPSAKQIESELDIQINTKIERVVANDRTVAISIGGFVGKAVAAKVTDVYAAANIIYPEVHNVASTQSFSDKVALGGFAGSLSNRSEIKNILTDTNIELGGTYEVESRQVVDVKFELGYENKRLSPVEIKKGEPVIEPSEAPEREGYNFLGWYLNDELYDFNKPINNSINLVAQWEKTTPGDEDKLVVIFDRGYSGLYYETVEVEKGGIVELPEDPKRDAHKFLGWYLDGELYDFNAPINHSVAVQARWVKIGIDRIELIYIGGIAGESLASTHEKNFARDPKITLYTNEGKYLINPTIGFDYELGDYNGGQILINDTIYKDMHYHLENEEVTTTPMNETELDEFFDSEFILEILNR